MRWSYKTVHFSLKKDGLLGSAFIDENEIEISLNEFGKSGWELVSFMEVNDGIIAVFKQPFGRDLPVIEEEPTIDKYIEKEPEQKQQQQKREVDAIPVTTTIEVNTEREQPDEVGGNDKADIGSIKIF